MRRFVLLLPVLSFVFFVVSDSRGAVALSALDRYLVERGYAGAQFIRHENTYRLPIIANSVAGDLTIDTGSPSAVIFQAVMKKFGLKRTGTSVEVRGAFGKGKEKIGRTTIQQLRMGNCTLVNVPAVVVSDPGGAGLYRTYGSTDGLFGLGEMLKYGAILDMSNHLLLLNPGGQAKGVSAGIRSILTKEGYTPVELSLRRGHLHVSAVVNGIPGHLVVDTGAFLTVLDEDFARQARLGGHHTGVYAQGFGAKARPVKVSRFPELKVGGFTIKNASATVAELDPELLGRDGKEAAIGLLGAEYLGLHGAVIDFNSGTLYLRPSKS